MSLVPSEVLEAVRQVPGQDSAGVALRIASLNAARERRTDVAFPVGELDPQTSSTSFGNLGDALSRGPTSPGEAALVGALLALSLDRAVLAEPAPRRELATSLVWLAARTRVDALPFLDAAFGDAADVVWRDVADLVSQPGGLDKGERLVAVSALQASTSGAAQSLGRELAERLPDSALRRAASSPSPAPALAGELVAAPFGVAGTVVSTLSGFALVRAATRLVGRLAFAYRRPASLSLGARGLEVEHRTELLGRVLGRRTVVVPFANLAAVAREVRYARLGLYVGLVALVVGTYVGVGLLVDGARVPGGSPSLFGMGIAAVGVGIVLDFGLSVAFDAARHTVRIVITPRRGARLCIGGLDPAGADRLLLALARNAGSAQGVPLGE